MLIPKYKNTKRIYFTTVFQVSDHKRMEKYKAQDVDFEFLKLQRTVSSVVRRRQFVVLGKDLYLFRSELRSLNKMRKYFSSLVRYAIRIF